VHAGYAAVVRRLSRMRRAPDAAALASGGISSVLRVPVEWRVGAESVDCAPFLDSLRAAVGADCVECVAVTDWWTACLDEDSVAMDQPVNQAATWFAGEYGARFRLRGTVVILGVDSRTTASCGLSPDQIDILCRRSTDELLD
jgi:hypothetical protein